MIDTGDTVLFKPNGEKWIVMAVIGDQLYWCGYPRGFAPASECKLLSKATPFYKLELLKSIQHDSFSEQVRIYAKNEIARMEAPNE